MYAVIKTGGKQYKVSKDDIISVEKLSEDAGKKIKLNEVLIISDKGKPLVGNPLIKGASVDAEIIEQTRSSKITVFKKKRRHNYRRKKGHKQLITNLKILKINSAEKKVPSTKKSKEDEETKKSSTTKGKTKTAKKKTETKKTATKSKKVEDKTKKTATKGKSKAKSTAKGSKE
ncbi:MAG: 50S ribosomal protein L21 [Pseudomonadota bacterium]|nr:50S ribosomal protein L21 [Pseudomonadota bacterium]MEC9481689.1 50S ribosomal protein L21 [Pseudomonadota bacterium]